MSEGRLVTLVGLAGVGKTRLALRLAEQVRRGFPDGVWVVDLFGELYGLAGQADGDLVVRTIIGTLGLRDASTDPPLDVLACCLSDKHLLLILDNCDHLLDVSAMLVARLLARAPRLRILATSRQPLDVRGEHVFQVQPLASPPRGVTSPDQALMYDAVRLFADRAHAADPRFALDSDATGHVVDLCRGLEGLPLGIELVAARTRSLPLEEIARRLGERLAY